jgi:hypothetical protein
MCNTWVCMRILALEIWRYSETCLERLPLNWQKSGLLRQMASYERFHLLNPLSASCSWDARIGGCRQNGLLVPRSPFIRHPPIERQSLPQWTSHWCMSPKKSKFQWTLYVPKTWKLTIRWCHKVAHGTERVKVLLASKGLKGQAKRLGECADLNSALLSN